MNVMVDYERIRGMLIGEMRPDIYVSTLLAECLGAGTPYIQKGRFGKGRFGGVLRARYFSRGTFYRGALKYRTTLG
jgi:hypothetical protein